MPSCSYPAVNQRGTNQVSEALARLADGLGWSDASGPFGRVIPAGARVLIKPNMVLHKNDDPRFPGQEGIDCLVTHASLIRAATVAALCTGAAEVLVGDAPIQGCDFEALTKTTGLDQWAHELRSREPRFKGMRDFRRRIKAFRDFLERYQQKYADKARYNCLQEWEKFNATAS